MLVHIRTRLISYSIVVSSVMLVGCDFSSRLTFHNRTNDTTMTPYPVRLEPPPPHREADPANALPAGGSIAIDTAGPNPVFYAAGITDEAMANGIYWGLDLYDADPMRIQYKVFHYRVPPGQAGSDPDLQPILLQNEIVEVADVNLILVVNDRGASPDGWTVAIRDAPP